MKKIFQITVEGNPKEVIEAKEKILDLNAKNPDICVDVIEIDKKRRYTKEDEWLFCIGMDVRIKKESSVEFISAFKANIAYSDQLKESEDGKYLMLHKYSVVLPEAIGRLNELVTFMCRANHLKFEGTLEVKLDVVPNKYANAAGYETITKEEAESRLLDSHACFLDWKEITAKTPTL